MPIFFGVDLDVFKESAVDCPIFSDRGRRRELAKRCFRSSWILSRGRVLTVWLRSTVAMFVCVDFVVPNNFARWRLRNLRTARAYT